MGAGELGAELEARFRPPDHLRPAIRAISERLFAAGRPVARELGYNLVAHGSMERDCDLVAIPWTDEAVDEDALVLALQAAFGEALGTECYRGQGWSLRPHGRKSKTLILLNTGLVNEVEPGRGEGFPFVDLSVMPRTVS